MTTQNADNQSSPLPEDMSAFKQARRKRSVAIALTLIGLVGLFYVMTILKFMPASNGTM
jgi:hypothetical protein